MNSQPNITAPPADATADQVEHAIDQLYGEVTGLVHRLHYLMVDLEEAFKFSRARAHNGKTLTFMFQEGGIDATLWLASDSWNRATDLKETLTSWQKRFDDARVAADRRAAA